MKSLYAALVFVLLVTPVAAQELHEDIQGVWKARVVEVVEERQEEMPWGETTMLVQDIRAELLDGDRKGDTVRLTNDYLPLDVGDTFYMNYMITVDGDEILNVREIDRGAPLVVLAVVFAALILAFGGMQGLRSLLSLAGSLVAIIYILIPALLAGYPPVPTAIAIATIILFVAIFFTHGFKLESLIAFLGTVGAVSLTGLASFIAVRAARLTGFGSDESIYLNINTAGTLDFTGLLLAGIIIGVLGVLDDIAITQVAVVRELRALDGKLSWKELYSKAVSVGREHVSALVNTLVLAYAGTALPLLLLISQSGTDIRTLVHQEIFASEIVRTLVGSMGLVFAVPLTTLLAAVWLSKKPPAQHNPGGHSHAHVAAEA